MKQINFEVTFLSDIVLQASSNNEGKITDLDFIPGSNFLGIIARDYEVFENRFDIFHSGKVRFGDATLVYNSKQTYKVPFSYFQPKLGGEIQNHHLIKEFSADMQLKQIRKGYITADGEVVTPKYSYTQKSAYDKAKRRSKDGAMYGYKAIQKGSIWSFSLRYDESIDIDKVVQKLEGVKQLGKSKSAQYGLVEIQKIENKTQNIEDFSQLENVVLYAQSRLALFDENAMPTYQPTPKNLGISEDVKILWEKSQIRTTTFTPYNSARKTKDYSRVVIEKGSVLVVDKLSQEDIQTLKKGAGAYLSEGFGEILINPTITSELYPTYKEVPLEVKKATNTQADKTLISFLTNRVEKEKEIFDTAKEVSAFIQKHKKRFEKISKSQWGQIRAICNQKDTTDANIKTKIKEFIDHGVTKKNWEDGATYLLQAVENNLKFAKLLSMMMPKQKGSDDE